MKSSSAVNWLGLLARISTVLLWYSIGFAIAVSAQAVTVRVLAPMGRLEKVTLPASAETVCGSWSPRETVYCTAVSLVTMSIVLAVACFGRMTVALTPLVCSPGLVSMEEVSMSEVQATRVHSRAMHTNPKAFLNDFIILCAPFVS